MTDSASSEKDETPKKEPEKKEKTIKIPDALLIGLIPLLAYGLIYSYESSFLNYFGVPSRFINYDISEIIFWSFVILTGIPTIILMFRFPEKKGGYFKTNLSRFFFSVMVGWVIISFIACYPLLILEPSIFLIIPVILLLATPIIFLVFPFFRKYKGGYFDKFEQMYGEKEGNKPEEIEPIKYNIFTEWIISKIGYKYFNIILIYLGVTALASLYGNAEAYKQSFFYVTKTTPDACVIIYTNPDKVLCKTIDLNTKQFEKGYIIYFLSELNGVKINYEDVGPFRLKPTITKTPILTSTISPTTTPQPTETPISISTQTPNTFGQSVANTVSP